MLWDPISGYLQYHSSSANLKRRESRQLSGEARKPRGSNNMCFTFYHFFLIVFELQ